MKTKEVLCKRIALSIFFLLVLCRTAGAQDSQKATLTAADAGTCSATSTACLVINVPSGSGGATFNIGANASANTVQFEATADYGTTWVALNVVPSNGTTAVTSTTSTGIWQANVAGYTKLRMRCSTFVGGTTTTYINLSTASARSNGGGGSVTHTAGNLTAFHLMLGNGLADSTVDSACVTNGTGALSGCTSLSAGSGASAAGATATGGFACVEGASTGWTPTVGQDYIRCDSTLHSFVASSNGLAEALIGGSALSGLTAAAASNIIANGNYPQTWNWAQTTDSQAGLTCGETSAATAGTIAANGSANQAACKTSTATNSTATPFSIEQGSITNTVATPAGQVRFTWNNGSLAGRGFGIFATNTASAANSLPLFVNVGNSTLWGVDKTGLENLNGNASISSTAPATATNAYGWKYCYSTGSCVGLEAQAEYHILSAGGNAWFSLSGTNPANDAGSGSPDSAAGHSFHNAVFMEMGKGHAGCGFTNIAASWFICGNSNTGEISAATAGSSSLGMLVRTQPGAIHVTAQTATKTIYTLCAASAGACNVAGQYRITWYFNQGGTACGTPAPGQVTFEVSYTDNAGAHTTVALPMNDNSSIAVFTSAFKFAASNTTGFASGEFNLWSTGAQPIQVTNTYTACAVGTGTWELTATAERVQ